MTVTSRKENVLNRKKLLLTVLHRLAAYPLNQRQTVPQGNPQAAQKKTKRPAQEGKDKTIQKLTGWETVS
jgi:hypothetical protein